MVDIINIFLLVILCILIIRLVLWTRKRIALIFKLKKLVRVHSGEIKFLRCPFLPTRMTSEKPDIRIKILDTVYFIRLYSGGNKKHLVHFASENYSVRYMKMALRMLSSVRRRGTGIAFVESSKAFTVRAKVYVTPPMKIPAEVDGTQLNTEKIILFNPAPHAVSYVNPERTRINLALTGDEMHGMKIFTGSSFVAYADRQTRKDDETTYFK